MLAASEAIIVTRETDPTEVKALQAILGVTEGAGEWERILGSLPIGEAALLPNAEEAGGRLRRFHVAPRMTFHVRHQHKYLDVPVPSTHAFVFDRDGVARAPSARTVKEFVDVLKVAPPGVLDGHLRRGDFSRWFADVVGDRPLASQIREIEAQYRLLRIPDVNDALVHVILERYTVRNGAFAPEWPTPKRARP